MILIICYCCYRNLKTSNILLRSEDGDCVVADLGLALVLKPMDDLREIANCGQVRPHPLIKNTPILVDESD